jgi:lysophospholipase L1-like esterase
MNQIISNYNQIKRKPGYVQPNFTDSSSLQRLLGVQQTVIGTPLNVGTVATNLRTDAGLASGMGAPIGPQQNFDSVIFRIIPKSVKPSLIRVRILENDQNGAVLGDTLVHVGGEIDDLVTVVAEFGSVIANWASTPLWFEFAMQSGYCWIMGGTTVYSTGAGYPVTRYTANASILLLSNTAAQVATHPYVEIANTGTRNVSVPFMSGAVSFGHSTFSAWGSPTRTLTPFNEIITAIVPNPTLIPTRAKCRIRAGSQSGAILGESSIDLNLTASVTNYVTFPFPRTVDPSGVVPWIEICTNGYWLSINEASTPVASPQFLYKGSQDVDTTLVGGTYPATQKNIWFQSALRSDSKTVRGGTSLRKAIKVIADASAATAIFAPVVDITVPASLPAVQDLEFNAYFDGIVTSHLRPEQFNIKFDTARGRLDDYRWRITPSSSGYTPATTSDIGNTAITITAEYNGSVLATAATTLKVKSKTTGAGQSRKCLLIGDSTLAGSEVPARINAIIAADNPTYGLTFLGTQGSGANKHEGFSGRKYNWFATDAASPFVFSGAFNFSTYMSTNSYTMASGDSVVFLLGINDFFGLTTDAAVAAEIVTVKANLAAMIASIQTYQAGLKIWLGMVIPPSHDQSAFGYNYAGSTQTRARYNRNIGLWRRELITTYGASTGSNIFLAPVNCNLDTRFNMVTSTEAVNQRNATTQSVQTNGVHPASTGYNQIGDAVYACLLSTET